MTRYEDLPAADRAAVDRAIGRRPAGKGRTRPRPSRVEVTGDQAGVCGCGERLPSYRAWERHRDTVGPAGHGRWNIDITPTL